ncbi:uncharacterized protein LOC143625623 [Bidens hawaiensis]|uniref:uncharacterized protein LOC143625623 n=1 Tax=Bidens hawaiensis TaxID=980011 RepID=UPI004049150F
MLITYSVSRPEDVWKKSWQYLIDGILYKQQIEQKNKDLVLSDSQLKNLALLEIQNFLLRNNSTLRCFPTMPFPDEDSISASTNRFMNEELAYDTTVMTGEFERLFVSLTDEQRDVYNEIMEAVHVNKGGVFFVYGYGGTGKTFLWKTLSASIRSKGKIVLNVASSGIASLLLEGGQTAHSRFLIPINLTEDSTCSITRNPDICNLMKKTDHIIWDEAPMIHKHAFEALNRTLKDIFKGANRNSCQNVFGGKVIVFGGDFRQILPVLQNGSRSDIVNASLSSSHIWSKRKVLRYRSYQNLQIFAEWLLELGEGKLGGENDGEAIIDIPNDLLIGDSSDPISDLIDFVYPSLSENFNDITYFKERAILAPLNEVVQDINDRFLALFPGDEVEYLSSDSIDQSDSVGPGFDPALQLPDFLNGLKMYGMPNHRLVLKVGVPIMLLRNIDQKNGLCNGTRLQKKCPKASVFFFLFLGDLPSLRVAIIGAFIPVPSSAMPPRKDSTSTEEPNPTLSEQLAQLIAATTTSTTTSSQTASQLSDLIQATQNLTTKID